MTTGGNEHRDDRGAASAAASLFDGDDETQALLRSMDWSGSALGPVCDWPAELTAAMRTVLPSREPRLLWWGPDLIQVYNDAFRKLLGRKHPALDRPAAECWAEIWNVLGPMARDVLAGHGASYIKDRLFLTTRTGRPEESYWTLSLSPIADAAHRIRGVLVAGNEVTDEVATSRRLATVRALTAVSVSGIGTVAEVCDSAMEVLSHDRASVPFATALLAEGENLRVICSFGLVPPSGDGADRIPLKRTPVLRDVVRSGKSTTIASLRESGLFRLLGTARPGPLGPIVPDRAAALPIRAGTADPPFGVLVLGLSPYRPSNVGYRTLLQLIAREMSVLLTDARAYEAERARAAALAAMDRRKAEFYQNISHELRTPLTLIHGPIRDLLDDDAVRLTDRHRRGLRAAGRGADRLRRLVDALLEFSRAESGVLRAHPEPTDLCTLTAELVSMFRAIAEAGGLTLRTELNGLTEPVDVDRGMWSTIVVNLLSNAVKFTAHGEIVVRLRPRGGQVELTVSDTGTGIPAEDLPMLFERFHRVPATCRRQQGDGIGLSVAADLARVHGGTISVESTLGEGSTFVVVLPRPVASPVSKPRPVNVTTDEGVREALAGAIPASAAIVPQTALLEPATPSGHGGEILVVEDDDDLRGYLARLLVDDGWRVRTAADVDQALAARTAPDVVLSDVMLPGRSGLDLVRAVRATPSMADVPIVLLTGRAGSDAIADGLGAGADDYITKPFHAKELLARIHVHYELSKLRGYALRQAQDQAARLYVALASNRQIGAAIGVLMATNGLTQEAAFAVLRTASQRSNRKLRDIAADVVLTGAIP